MAETAARFPPPPFWRTRYFAVDVVNRPDRRDIDSADISRALVEPQHSLMQPDGRTRRWVWVQGKSRWLRVIVEAVGETVHNAFWDRTFKP